MCATQIRHKLPDDPGQGDLSWFKGQNAFEQTEIKRQVAFKRTNWPDLPNGPFVKLPNHTYPHILPANKEALAFYPGFSSDVLTYMSENDIAIHSEALNLKSSQVACLNFLFPLRLNLSLASKVLRDMDGFQNIKSVENIEFEYTGQDETNRTNQPFTEWMGEPKSGKRGQNRTSIDAAIFWTDKQSASHITLIEWKYTERNFGVCSAFEKASPEKKASCQTINVLDDPASHCVVAGDGRNCGRHYWDHISAAGISLKKLSTVAGCPFQGPFYQLMRQFLMAHYLRKNDMADEVDVIVVEFEGNESLRKVPPQLKSLGMGIPKTVVEAWNSALADRTPPLRVITAEDLISAYDFHLEPDLRWRQYIINRYDV
jgi:hypothetical protein